MKKPLPKLKSDEEAEAFLETADLSEYDLSSMVHVRFEFGPKTRRITMRLPEDLYTAVKGEAKRSGMPYQRFIRKAIEEALSHPQPGVRA
jgi:predicted DNA binding CopG/RHH family protein